MAPRKKGNNTNSGNGQGLSEAAQARGTSSKGKPNKPALTHFLSLPIGHHANLRAKVQEFTSALVSSDPAISGLDSTIVVQPRRLHFTLGTLSLEKAPHSEAPEGSTMRTNTLESASALVASLRPRILELLQGQPLRIGLESMDILMPERKDPSMAHVLILCPDTESEEGIRLKAICDLVRKTFSEAGLLVDAKQALKLHCTILNTRYRRPRAKRGRVPFSYSALRASSSFMSLLDNETRASLTERAVLDEETPKSAPSLGGTISSVATKRQEKFEATRIPFGTYTVDELQLCKMGSWGLEGEYVADAKCSIISSSP